jgi:hypothetical protein
MFRLPRSCRSSTKNRRTALRAALSATALALLAACAGHAPQLSAPQLAAEYAAHARGNYVPPGPPGDPWGPYVREASQRFDVPDQWIRAVMRVESDGQEYQQGELIISPKGAMGLMQVMPDTYEELRGRYALGDDPYDPHDNILAGAAYLREMYDIYGSPGFLAAYNAGPHRLDDYLSDAKPLPDETRRYVAMIGPAVEGIYPAHRSPAEAYAMNSLPIEIPPGLRYGRSLMLASARHPVPGRRTPGGRHHVLVARAAEAPRGTRSSYVTRVALVTPPSPPPGPEHHRGGFHFISRAMAEQAPIRHAGGSGGGAWAIQVGAYGSENLARHAIGTAKAEARGALAMSRPVIEGVHQSHGQVWRARITGLSREDALRACGKLSHGRTGCMVLSPVAQS